MPARRLLMRKIRATRRKIVLGGMVVAARVWKLNVGGLDWPMVYNRAAALHKPSPVMVTGLSPVMVTGLKGYVQGQVDLVAADHVAGSTTSAAAPTEDQQQQRRDESRLDGLIGHLAVTSRALDHPFNEDRGPRGPRGRPDDGGQPAAPGRRAAPRLGRRGETRSSRRPNQEDAEVIRMSQWAEVRHLHVVEGVPKKEIARRLKLDVKTVRRAIGRPTPPVQVSPPRPGTRLAHLAPSTNRRRRRSTSTAAVSAWRTTAPTAAATSRARSCPTAAAAASRAWSPGRSSTPGPSDPPCPVGVESPSCEPQFGRGRPEPTS